MTFTLANGRLTAADKLSIADFHAIAAQLGVTPGYAKKLGDKPVAAQKIADVDTEVVTINTKDGSEQARKIAKAGDSIMTRLNKDGTVKLGATNQPDQWAVDAAKAEKLYNPLGASNEYGTVVGGNNEGWFVTLAAGGDIVPPWGGNQQTTDGVLFYSDTTQEVYLNEASGFETFNILTPEAAKAAA